MSGPKSGQGGDAFGDFFGDPSPSGRMAPAPDEAGATPFAGDPDDEPTQDVELRRRTTQATQASAPVPVITPEPTPHGAVPESWWQQDAEAPAPPVAPQSSTWHAQPSPQATHPQAPRRGLSPLAMVGMLVGGVLIGGICAGATVMALDQGDEPVAQSTTVTETSSPESTTPSTTTTTSSTSSSSSKTSSASPTRQGKLPAGAKECAGPKQGTAVGSGNDVTSCAFASAVRDAYLAEKPTDGKASLEVRSPVTKKSYTMNCTGAAVTRCTGGNNAVVFLY